VEDERGATNPVFGGNRLKIGVFAFNLTNGSAITTVPERWHPNWPDSRRIAQIADRGGLDALVPVARWKGFGGRSAHAGTSYETYAWAAGLAEATRHIAVMSTSHVPTVHPIFAAKQAATIDHISGGRFGLNIVCGWYGQDLGLFGVGGMGHDELYDFAQEWLDVVRAAWSRDDEYDFDGRFFHVKDGFQEPKPLQRPHPALMNAGSSDVGRHYAARNCDLALISMGRIAPLQPAGAALAPRAEDWEEARRRVEAYRGLARDTYGRELQIWSRAYVVCRPTEREALEYVRRYVFEYGDWEAVRGRSAKEVAGLPDEQARMLQSNIIAGAGGCPVVGTPEQITERLRQFSDLAGVDGLLITWVDYNSEVEQFVREVVPLMEQAGLRQPYRAAAAD
jgi:FMNH2-dependent dimethyl sulfone monooxygenase